MAAIRTSTAVASSFPAYSRTAGRAVHIKISPRPLNLAEGRQILRKLEEYGEVVMYKHLKYEPEIRAPHTALAIFGTESAAAKALAASPLSLSVDRRAAGSMTAGSTQLQSATQVQQKQGTSKDDDKVGEDEMHTTPPPSSSEEQQQQQSQSGQQSSPSSPTKHLTLSLSPSTQNHPAYLSRQHYHSSFKLDLNTHLGRDLESRVPYKALADIQTHLGEVPLRVRNARAEEQKVMGRGWWKKSLGEVWEEGVRERREEEEEERRREEGGQGGQMKEGVITKYDYTVSKIQERWRIWGQA